MVTGKILWFGGQTREGRVNNFGFIQFQELGENKKIYVSRQEVSEEMQNICENDQNNGEGILVKFEVENYKRKGENLQRAISLKLIKNFGLIISQNEILSKNPCLTLELKTYDGIKLCSYEIAETSKKRIISHDFPPVPRRGRSRRGLKNYERDEDNTANSFKQGELIEFYLQNEEAIILRQAEYDEVSIELVKNFIDKVKVKNSRNLITYYISNLEDDNAAKYVLDKISSSDTSDALTLLDLIQENYNNLILAYDDIRLKLREYSIARYADFIQDNLWLVDEDKQNQLWSELIEVINSIEESTTLFTLLKPYLSNVNTKDAIKFISDKIHTLDENNVKEFLKKSFEYNQEAFLENQSLHPYLREYNFNQYLEVVKQILELDNQILNQSVVQDLIGFLPSCSEEKQSQAWRNIAYLENSLEYHGSLWDVAPLEYKQKVIEEKYAEFFDLVEQFENSGYAYSKYISRNYKELYDFNDNDKELAKLWGRNTRNPFEKAKMLSARGAEKLVQYFYQKTGNKVQDIAIHQITHQSDAWKKADISVDQDNSLIKLIDVKNARQNINSNVYSEFCVPLFKRNRGEDVIIAAVLSPNLYPYYMNVNTTPNFPVNDPKYLGELTHFQLQTLTQSFSDSVVRLDMTRGFDRNRYLAPWLFDYNLLFYQEQVNIAEEFSTLHSKNIPKLRDIEHLEKSSINSYLSLFIYANKQLPITWKSEMPSWTKEFVNLLYRTDNSLINLPHLYMAILKHFLKMLFYQDSNYCPEKLLNLLGNQSFPLKIYDPLCLIKDFCYTLKIVWNHRQKAKITGFKIFKFDGRGLLSGKRSEDDSYSTTILAFCGGWIEGQGKCGYSPLVIGKEDNCHYCGNLICPQDNCGHCSSNCPGYEERKQDDEDK